MEFTSNTEPNSENASNTPTQNWKEVTEAIMYLKEESKSHKDSMRKLAGQMEKLLNNQIAFQQQQQQEHGQVDREERSQQVHHAADQQKLPGDIDDFTKVTRKSDKKKDPPGEPAGNIQSMEAPVHKIEKKPKVRPDTLIIKTSGNKSYRNVYDITIKHSKLERISKL